MRSSKTDSRRRVVAVAVAAILVHGAADAFDADAVAERLAEAVRYRTVSHQDPADDDRAAFAGFREFLERTYPRLHATLRKEVVNGDALLFTWEGRDDARPPVLLMAHYDVVPVEPGTEEKWTRDPFGGEIADGFVWGRGTIDDKGSLVLLCEAVEALLDEGFRPDATVYLAFGHDEEVGGRRGAMAIAGRLADRDVRLRYVLDEGGAVVSGAMEGVTKPIASVGIAEKGYVSLELIARTEGGHSSRPPRETAIGVLAAAVDRVQRGPMPARIERATRLQLEAVAPHLPFARRLALSNLWLSSPLVVSVLSGDPTGNALVRTTTAPTVFHAGVKENVLPSQARAIVNFRILPGDSIASVREHVRDVVDDERIEIQPVERMMSEPSPTSSIDSPAYGNLAATIRDLFPEAVVAPGLVLGGTDSRHFAAIADDVYRFIPVRLGPGDLERFHGTDERVAVADLEAGVAFYRRILLAEGAAAPVP